MKNCMLLTICREQAKDEKGNEKIKMTFWKPINT
jgi:hypothetical protein